MNVLPADVGAHTSALWLASTASSSSTCQASGRNFTRCFESGSPSSRTSRSPTSHSMKMANESRSSSEQETAIGDTNSIAFKPMVVLLRSVDESDCQPSRLRSRHLTTSSRSTTSRSTSSLSIFSIRLERNKYVTISSNFGNNASGFSAIPSATSLHAIRAILQSRMLQTT